MTAMLLVGAVLLVRTVWNLQRFDLGFDPRHLHAVSLELPSSRYPSAAAKDAAIAQVQARITADGDVTSITSKAGHLLLVPAARESLAR